MLRTFPTEEADMRGPDSPFVDAVESYLRSRHDLDAWTKRSYAKSLKRIAQRCPTIADFTLELVNGYLEEKLSEDTRPSRTMTAGPPSAWPISSSPRRSSGLARSTAWSCPSSQSAGGSHSPTPRSRSSSTPRVPR
jgi:hypothetical protein